MRKQIKTVRFQAAVMVVGAICLFFVASCVRQSFSATSNARPGIYVPPEKGDDFIARAEACKSKIEAKKGYLTKQDAIACNVQAGREILGQQ